MEFYFSLIIFLYLFDGDETSWSVLAPSGVGVLIAFWKIKKAVVVTNLADKPTEAQPAQAASGAPSTSTSTALVPAVTGGATTDGLTVGTFRITFAKSYQSKTKEHDDQAMKYLMYVMVPCLIGYTAYSAYYDEHRGWYSFINGTQVRFIYFFGFAMMTPQIFINYKLKSVTALPWRTFVYKALNTFIDDLFAFIIKMPTMHRLACFRDDIVFIILLYQRWIYPVDEKRSQDGDDDDEEGVEGNAANPTSSTTTAAASGAAAAALPSTEELLKELKRIEEKNK
ncbi:transmembrane protein, putative [Bodo saltans]|uniref:Transmembrane protein, putative n=1 Tax=Bodo saltans TaxID=75058 RepID=A0A0S4IN46_BODSA|nr:transmembrane protein, putative [Bodo saltans]|eukprot:CUE74102.1 transmembrane protein, putative [Bodo saltans]